MIYPADHSEPAEVRHKVGTPAKHRCYRGRSEHAQERSAAVECPRFLTEEYSSAEEFLGPDPSNRIDCLVIDVDLGGISGIVLQRQLQASGSKLPVIFITALEDSTLEAEAAQTGCIAYLRKPFPAALLIDAINSALAGAPPSDRP